MSRQAPERTSAQQKEHERRVALLALDVPAIRAWMERYGFGALGDDQTVLIAMHETRVVDPKMPQKAQRESIVWLREHHSESTTIAAYPGEFRGPAYGKRS